MILLLGLVLGALLGVVAGGRVVGLSHIRLRGDYALVGLLVAQGALPALSVAGVSREALFWMWAITFPAMVVVCLFNVGTPGMAVVCAGLALNAAAVLLNHGMPVLPTAVVAAGGSLEMLRSPDFAHNAATTATGLPFLADVLPIPGPPGVRGVASAGDVLLACGVAGTVGSAVREAVRLRTSRRGSA